MAHTTERSSTTQSAWHIVAHSSGEHGACSTAAGRLLHALVHRTHETALEGVSNGACMQRGSGAKIPMIDRAGVCGAASGGLRVKCAHTAHSFECTLGSCTRTRHSRPQMRMWHLLHRRSARACCKWKHAPESRSRPRSPRAARRAATPLECPDTCRSAQALETPARERARSHAERPSEQPPAPAAEAVSAGTRSLEPAPQTPGTPSWASPRPPVVPTAPAACAAALWLQVRACMIVMRTHGAHWSGGATHGGSFGGGFSLSRLSSAPVSAPFFGSPCSSPPTVPEACLAFHSSHASCHSCRCMQQQSLHAATCTRQRRLCMGSMHGGMCGARAAAAIRTHMHVARDL
jgi:hypothetical protein